MRVDAAASRPPGGYPDGTRPYEIDCDQTPEAPMTDSPTPTDELLASREGPVLTLALNRPKRRNALSRSLVNALREAIEAAAGDGVTRAIVIRGEGRTFCAGGDISEYAHAPDGEGAREDGRALRALLGAMTESPLPIVGRAHGGIFGGGIGLLAACDIVAADMSATFSLSEARLGIVPAVISPFIVAAIGPREARARMLRAAAFDADTARRIGLVHELARDGDLDVAVDRVIVDLLKCAPEALAVAKRIPTMVAGTPPHELETATVDLFAERVTSDEGREGLRAFLEKRPPSWVTEGRR
jgi:methylglutaconyl-CoA hydratase